MFLPFYTSSNDTPSTHKRSKTIVVLFNQPKNPLSHSTKKLRHFQSNQSIKNSQLSSKKYSKENINSLRKIAQQIERFVNRELQYPQLLTYIQKDPSPLKTIGSQASKHSEIKDNIQNKKNSQIFKNYSNGFREPKYLTLLQKSETIKDKSFIPHYNWKHKLNRMKNLGNYGHVYKKEFKPQKKIFSSIIKQSSLNQTFDSTKITLDPQIIITCGFGEHKIFRKNSTGRRCYTSVADYQINHDIKNHTYHYGEKIYQKVTRQNKTPCENSKNYRNSQKKWSFEPWDVKKEADIQKIVSNER